MFASTHLPPGVTQGMIDHAGREPITAVEYLDWVDRNGLEADADLRRRFMEACFEDGDDIIDALMDMPFERDAAGSETLRVLSARKAFHRKWRAKFLAFFEVEYAGGRLPR